MEIRDPIHGSIPILDEEIKIIEHPFFQRLRNIKQLGFAEYVFPGATHTRFLHSIGVMHTATLLFDKLFKENLNNKHIARLRQTTRLAALLHDIGHAPLSHSTEIVMPKRSNLKLPSKFLKKLNPNKQATHEDYTIKSIVDSSFTHSFKKVTEKFDIDKSAIAELILGECLTPGYFEVSGINYFPILHQLISSEMDADRLDYLLRDSYFCGVSYGKYDLDWIVDNLNIGIEKKNAYLAISERALSTFNDFLLSRFHMFMMVYFHYKCVCLEQLMYRYFDSTENEYVIPADIELYQEHDDHYLLKVLRNSENKWAKQIVQNKIPQKIFEMFGNNQELKFNQLIAYLKKNNLSYILCESKGRLSKYYNEGTGAHTKFPLKVLNKYSQQNKNQLININDATDLFEKYSEYHSVVRVHLDQEDLSIKIKKQIEKIIYK